ncbi:uncharacterized protein PGTG_11602 [Puccinia graminis f. sp. tritici CRL 75-36-700-3]|uniref:Uncharacterized protein n=1 Tax=Puccinia graminis f. sp. tritici (strain CRL 75-36-700-3 / race SCCL) TaxID=418459 RepID=E3KNH1_PUCGT|nr:uncharacterized protein PGTG_11602 [Puccinia graminis f. sp. tritici CRL 75-36-700-3]EFP85846.1 hypothetical protein PGTG_11602 [Puccinia graminis f. sp. tritici CRL 75-36-700-3]
MACRSLRGQGVLRGLGRRSGPSNGLSDCLEPLDVNRRSWGRSEQNPMAWRVVESIGRSEGRTELDPRIWGPFRTVSEDPSGSKGLGGCSSSKDGLRAVPSGIRGSGGRSEASNRFPRVRSGLRGRLQRSGVKPDDPKMNGDQGVSWGSRDFLGFPVGTGKEGELQGNCKMRNVQGSDLGRTPSSKFVTCT